MESGLVGPVSRLDGPRDDVGPPEDTEEIGVDGPVPGKRRVDTVEPLRKKDGQQHALHKLLITT